MMVKRNDPNNPMWEIQAGDDLILENVFGKEFRVKISGIRQSMNAEYAECRVFAGGHFGPNILLSMDGSIIQAVFNK